MEDLKFKVYNRRRGNDITYTVKKTDEGWYLDYIAIYGDCDKEGKPYFYSNFNQDYIEYPVGFGDFLAHLWKQIDDEEIEKEEAQEKLQQLADWVTLCEKGQPEWSEYN